MANISRRQALVVAGGATVIAAGGAGVTLLGGDNDDDTNGSSDSGDDANSDSSAGSNVIQDYEVVSGSQSDKSALSVSLLEGEADQIALLATGEQVASVDIAPAETSATITISNRNDVIPPSTDEIVAYSGSTVVDRVDWSPSIDVSLTGVEVGEWLRLTFENNSDIGIRPSQGYVSGGFPTEVHDSDRVGDNGYLTMLFPNGGKGTFNVKREGAVVEQRVLTPPNGECTGETHTIEVTMEFEQLDPRQYSIDVELSGEPTEGSNVGKPVYCSDATASRQDT
jgi:hypothetical protein